MCARIRLDDSANPPNGSWGIVKVQPQLPIAVGGRPGFNDPPTAVGGIREKFLRRCRSGLNYPPTAVGGIRPVLFTLILAHMAPGTVPELTFTYAQSQADAGKMPNNIVNTVISLSHSQRAVLCRVPIVSVI